MEGPPGGDPIKARFEDDPRGSGGFRLAILGEGPRARGLSILIGLLLLGVLTYYSLQTVGRRPWKIQEILEKPSEYEGSEVVLSLGVRDFAQSDPVLVEVERDGLVLDLPLSFTGDPGLFRGATLTMRGESRLVSQGAVIVLDYHLADPRPKAILGLVGAAICLIYLLKDYAPVWHRMVLEPR